MKSSISTVTYVTCLMGSFLSTLLSPSNQHCLKSVLQVTWNESTDILVDTNINVNTLPEDRLLLLLLLLSPGVSYFNNNILQIEALAGMTVVNQRCNRRDRTD